MSTAGGGVALNRGWITVCIMLATIMQVVDTTIVNVALPHMQGSMSATQDQISWVLTSYIVIAAIFTPLTGVLADKLGRKRLLLICVVAFIITSMMCGAATSIEQIVLFRGLQGAAGAGLVPLSQAVMLDIYPREKQGSAMALWGMGVMVGPILGPTLGGWLTEYYSWRWAFYINLPVGALQLMLDRGNSLDWFGSTEIVLEATITGLALYLFLVHMFTTDKPFIEPGLFADRNFSIGLLLMFLVGVMMFSGMALLPPFLQGLLGFPVITAGLIMAPRGFGTMVAMMVVGRLIGRVDSRVLMFFGLLLMAWSLYDMALFNTNVGVYEVVYTGMIQGFGMGFIFVPLSAVAFATLAARYRAEGTAMFSLVRNIGMSIGISIVMTLLGREMQRSHAALSESITPFRAALRAPDVPSFWSSLHGTGLFALDGEVTRQALTVAYVNDFRFMLYMSVLALPLLFLMRKPPAAQRQS